MATTDPAILDLSTLIPDRQVIRIDGETYHLRSPDELTLAESHQFTRWAKELETLAADPARVDGLERLLAEVTAHAIADAPPDVLGRLKPRHHMAIVEVFTVLLLSHRARRAGAVTSAVQSIGPRPSRAFSWPMEASPIGGSTAHRPHSSGPT